MNEAILPYGSIGADGNEDKLMPATDVKRAAHELLDSLPESITWEEIAYRMEVRASIERGLTDVDKGRVVSQEDVERRFGLER